MWHKTTWRMRRDQERFNLGMNLFVVISAVVLSGFFN